MDRNNTLVQSDDGSPTLRSSQYGVTYHSIYGAIDETITVFLSAGLQYHILSGKEHISVFEMGFGTGLNAFLTMIESFNNQIHVSYTAIEKYPIDDSIAKMLDYPSQLNLPQFEHAFRMIHKHPPFSIHPMNEFFSLEKIEGDIQQFQTESKFDLIYYDAFAPSAQPELWTDEAMQKMYNLNEPGGTLVTYCAKGSFKRALKNAGYLVQSLPGPPGKREMTRAIKPG